ncbi:YihY/virulence factor BrkB family protein [Pseudothauera nasutitermitis]|uniref:YihY/virulence factor BrkB family protein n=1 Tax=Pseudothauera nasutitermitis TaxID=2565930 RepID=A0A4S4AWZ5_9RHOO|nr:YihY/virulence factor BrkB family protein [Pseudothauera nasutitermitis]THF64583.1 YihY/virulence factor BrkB family protein [Pseudothauera nasutitermitis]
MKNWADYWIGVLKHAVRVWLDAQVFIHAAALAFFTVFSVAPVMIVAVGIVGLVLGESAAHGEIAQQLEAAIGPEAAAAVQTAVAGSRPSQSGILPTLAGFGAMLFGATTVFAQMQNSLNNIWGVAPKPTRSSILIYLKGRLLSLTVVLSIGFVLLVSLLLNVAVRALVTFAQDWLPVPASLLLGLDHAVSLSVATLLFATIFRVLPDVQLAWRDVWLGAFITALLFVFGRALIALYLSTTGAASAYGAAGSLVLLLLWVNYSSLILLFGAAFTRANVEARGVTIRPRATAVCIRRALVEDTPGR